MSLAFVEGFSLSFGLILAIGAQNAFVIRQGLLRSNTFLVCLICALSDAILIYVGVFGVGAWLNSKQAAQVMMTMFAIAFLLVYGVLRVRSAIHPKGLVIDMEIPDVSKVSLVLTTLAFTWLNPHVYLDTLVLIGGASSGYSGVGRNAFALGAASASFLFFFSLGYGAQFFSERLRHPQSWRIIDSLIALLMFLIALSLTLNLLR